MAIQIPPCPISRPVYALPPKRVELIGVSAQEQTQVIAQQNHEWIPGDMLFDSKYKFSQQHFWCKFCLYQVWAPITPAPTDIPFLANQENSSNG